MVHNNSIINIDGSDPFVDCSNEEEDDALIAASTFKL